MHYLFAYFEQFRCTRSPLYSYTKPKIVCIPIQTVAPVSTHTHIHTPPSHGHTSSHRAREPRSCVMHVIADVVRLFSFITTVAVARHRRDARPPHARQAKCCFSLSYSDGPNGVNIFTYACIYLPLASTPLPPTQLAHSHDDDDVVLCGICVIVGGGRVPAIRCAKT